MKKTDHRTAAGATKALIVRLGNDLYAIPIAAVVEVLPALPIELVPQCPSFVRGVIFVRGHLIPVVDAAERLGLRGHQRPDEPHIVCLRIRDRLVGVELDEALDLLEIDPRTIMATDQINGGDKLCKGILEHDGAIIRLLDPEKLIAREEAAALERTSHPHEETARDLDNFVAPT